MDKMPANKPVGSTVPVAKPVMPAAPVKKTEVKPQQPRSAPVAVATPTIASPAKAIVPDKRAVKIKLYERSATSVFLAGSFNGWDPQTTPLQNLGTGKWETTLMLAPGKYEYRFVVDGKWKEDPLAKDTAPNPFGGVNSVLAVK